jgi:hypothetical protein
MSNILALDAHVNDDLRIVEAMTPTSFIATDVSAMRATTRQWTEVPDATAAQRHAALWLTPSGTCESLMALACVSLAADDLAACEIHYRVFA